MRIGPETRAVVTGASAGLGVPIGSHIGPVARAVLREATCPVLLATPRPHRAAYHP